MKISKISIPKKEILARKDMFQDRKSIHIKLPTDYHTRLKSELSETNLTMQDIVEEFIRLFLEKDINAIRIFDIISRNKIESIISDEKNNFRFKARKNNLKKYSFNKNEEEALYNLILSTKEEE